MPMERELQALIGHRLRARYAEVLAEPIPDKFLDLLDQLDRPSGDEMDMSGIRAAALLGGEQRR
jgi:hypothetical protein